MKLYFLLVRRVPPVPSPVLLQACETLSHRGFEIETGIAEEMLQRPEHLTVSHDLYILKSHTELSLSLAGILHAQGARLLNPYPSCLVAQNKIVVSHILRAAGVPAPDCWVTGDLRLLRPIVEERPVILKPYRGHRGHGVEIVRTVEELARIMPPESPVLVQAYIEGTGEDLKVFVVGDEVFAVRKTFSPTSFAEPGRPAPVSAEVRRIALRCGQLFGLGLYGLDLIENTTGVWVVDLNTFPGYKGVPHIALRIADYIEGYALGKLTLPAITTALRASKQAVESPKRPLASLMD
jgi:ribosomal protein S6--L-glutamate ligase